VDWKDDGTVLLSWAKLNDAVITARRRTWGRCSARTRSRSRREITVLTLDSGPGRHLRADLRLPADLRELTGAKLNIALVPINGSTPASSISVAPAV
jgi:hypothetical protein